MKNSWTDSEIKNLFNQVEEHKKHNRPVLDAFIIHAKKNYRKPLSVRNFYYQKVDEIMENENLQKKFSINIKLHEKNNFAKFDERQSKRLLDYVTKKLKEGKSVRNACLELAHNDAEKLVRFQNKYQQLIKKERGIDLKKDNKKDIFTQKIDNFYQKSSNNENLQNKNIINFPIEQKMFSSKLTDAELQSLFLGLVKLVKKSALSEIQEKIKSEQEKISVVLRKTTVDIGQKSEKINRLLDENKKLSNQVLNLKQKLEELRSLSVKI